MVARARRRVPREARYRRRDSRSTPSGPSTPLRDIHSAKAVTSLTYALRVAAARPPSQAEKPGTSQSAGTACHGTAPTRRVLGTNVAGEPSGGSAGFGEL